MADHPRSLTTLLVGIGLVFLGILGWVGYDLYAQQTTVAVDTATPTLPYIVPAEEEPTVINRSNNAAETGASTTESATSYLRGTIVDLPTGAVTLNVDVPVGSAMRTLTVQLTTDTSLAVQETTVERVPGSDDMPAVESATTVLAVGDTIVVYSGSPILSDMAEVTATRIELLR